MELEEDTSDTHASRKGKLKETKAQGTKDMRQATGVVTTTMAGEMLPGQLIVAGKSQSVDALPELEGYKYVKNSGPHPGHAVGVTAVRNVNFNAPNTAQVDTSKWISKWIGHWAQTENHWANIPTSILDQIFVPFLQKNAATNGLSAYYPAILIVDCWYGWKDQDKNKQLQHFRDYVRERYPWLKLLFVPAACTDLAQPADRGQIAWLKGHMRNTYTQHFTSIVLQQLKAGKKGSEIKIDFGAVPMKKLLAKSFAFALSEMPQEKILKGWSRLRIAVTDQNQLYFKALQRMDVLFPNGVSSTPEASEEDPNLDPSLDFEPGEANDFQLVRSISKSAISGGQSNLDSASSN